MSKDDVIPGDAIASHFNWKNKGKVDRLPLNELSKKVAVLVLNHMAAKYEGTNSEEVYLAARKEAIQYGGGSFMYKGELIKE